MIDGYAKMDETKKFLEKLKVAKRESPYFFSSPIGIGTHLGEMTMDDSLLYRESIQYALENGINFIDTAINYRGMRSERDVGHVLLNVIQHKGAATREQIVISTKAGIIPGDIEANLVPADYLKKILFANGIIQESDLHIVDHHRHVLTPGYYDFAIQQSRKHLQLQTIDIHYIHNPEISMKVIGPAAFYKQLGKLFSFYEEQVQKGTIRFYGMATWNAFLYHPEEPGYISLENVIKVAEGVAGDQHHFKFIQLPYNHNRLDGELKRNQLINGKLLTVFEAAKELNVFVTTSAPFIMEKRF